jgi:hypothetical protein
MADLVSLQDALDHLRVDTDADNSWLMMAICGVSAAVFTWLKEPWRAYEVERDANGRLVLDSNGDPIYTLDDNGDPIVNPVVRMAVLQELAQQYRFRDGSGAAYVPAHWGHGYVLGIGATSLLSGLRKSTVG